MNTLKVNIVRYPLKYRLHCSNSHLCRLHNIWDKDEVGHRLVFLVCRHLCFPLRGKYGDMVPVTVHAQTREDDEVENGVESSSRRIDEKCHCI